MNLILPKVTLDTKSYSTTTTTTATTDLIPWQKDEAIINALKVLWDMYNSLEGKEKEFVNEHVKFLLEQLEGFSDMSIDFLFINNTNNVQ